MDTRTGRVGIVVAVRDTDVSPRPLTRFGREWTASPDALRVATRDEITRAYADTGREPAADGSPQGPLPPRGRAREDAGKRLRRRGQVLAPGTTLMPHDDA